MVRERRRLAGRGRAIRRLHGFGWESGDEADWRVWCSASGWRFVRKRECGSVPKCESPPSLFLDSEGKMKGEKEERARMEWEGGGRADGVGMVEGSSEG